MAAQRVKHGLSFINHKVELSCKSPKTPVQTINLLFDFCVCVIDKLCFVCLLESFKQKFDKHNECYRFPVFSFMKFQIIV